MATRRWGDRGGAPPSRGTGNIRGRSARPEHARLDPLDVDRPPSDRSPSDRSPAERPTSDRSRAGRPTPRVYSVVEVNRALRSVVEDGFSDFWVEGELSDVRRSAAGHVYFTLNDTRATGQLKVVLYNRDAARARARLVDGELVRVRGNLTVYEQRGALQLQARTVLRAGEGDLAARFEQIRQRLTAEGLTAPERKRPLPRAPRTIGVVTSLHGAALRDVIRVAQARSPVRLVVADCRVQGDEAPATIVTALTMIQQLSRLDTIIVCRGGGSAEDLWAFNDERVARAIAATRVPTVVGVGHESDVTIAELVADARASTPSNAAELAVPEREALLAELEGWERRLTRGAEVAIDGARLRLERLAGKLKVPRAMLGPAHRELAGLEERAARALRGELGARRARLRGLRDDLTQLDPRARLARDRRTMADLEQRLQSATRRRLERERREHDARASRARAAAGPTLRRAQAELLPLVSRLDALSPLRVLERGYAIAFDAEGRALRDASALAPADVVRLRLHRGELVASVTEVRVEAESDAPPSAPPSEPTSERRPKAKPSKAKPSKAKPSKAKPSEEPGEGAS